MALNKPTGDMLNAGSDVTPQPLGAATHGTSTAYSRADHVHAMPTAADVGAVADARQIIAGTGLTGGGDLSADRTLSVSYGTTAGTAAQGNDSRLSDSRTPTAHAASHASGGSDPVTLDASQVTGLAASATTDATNASNISSGTLAIAIGGTGANTQETARLAMGGFQQVDFAQTSTISGNVNTGVTPNVLTYNSNGTTTYDGIAPSVGDIVFLSGQGTGTTPTNVGNGPWIVTNIGSASTPVVLTRPSWFSGTVKNASPCIIKYGQNNAGVIRQVIGAGGTSKTDITVGTSALTVVTLSYRGSNLPVSGGTMTGRITAAANSATINPITFQASTALLTTPTAHALEWDGTLMYLTNSAGVRTTNLAFVPVPATATSAGVAGQVAYDSTGFYVCVATNTWRKTALSTF